MGDDFDLLFKPIVLVTGFGPFLNHPVNASWEAVKLLNKEDIEQQHSVELVQLELPVTYEHVDEFVPALWDTHTPKLMIHVGVSSIATDITLEMQAHRKGYRKLDYLNNCPANQTCTSDGAMRIKTQLDVDKICKQFNEDSPPNTKAVPSYDAGRYLCEYIYYTSLSVDKTRTLFVHVPDTNIYPTEQTARALEKILELSLNQVKEMESTQNITEKLKETGLSNS